MIAIERTYSPDELVALSSLAKKGMSDNAALNTIAASLIAIVGELGRLNDSIKLITSLEAEIVLDLRSRREAERASYAAYHKASAEAEAKPA